MMSLRVCTLTLLSWISVVVFVTQGMPNDCKDKIKDCSLYASGDCDGKYRPWAMKNCRLTCNLCNEDPTKVQGECKDFSTRCAKYVCDEDPGFNGKKNAESNCRKFCGLCDPSDKYTGPKSNKKSCYDSYTNRTYDHQMEWKSDCSYCKCDDGASTCLLISCRGPRYPSCKKVVPQKPGACCTKYVCPKFG